MPCALMILLVAAAAAAPTIPTQVDAILKDYGRADAPGASVLVAQDGKVLYRKAFGLANLEERTPITTATNFRLASVTKQFTATAVLLLAERGKLSLDDPLTRFFPGFARAAHGVKVRHLLGHTSGFLDYEELIPPGTTVPLKDRFNIPHPGRPGWLPTQAPHRPVRAGLPHTVPQVTVSLRALDLMTDPRVW